jgi:hypothetical protein
MSFTVVVPTTGDSTDLPRSLHSMLRAAGHAGPDAEVLVVVNGRSSAPALAQVGSPLLRVIHLQQANVSRARNVGIAAARHDTVIFGDDSAIVEPTWCVRLAGALRDPAYPVVTAPVRVPVIGPLTAFLNYQRIFDAPPLDATEARTVTGHCALRRDRLPAAVRYEEQQLPHVGEDVAFGNALRAAGVRIRWLADVIGVHPVPERLEEITERAFRYGRGAALIWRGGCPGPVVDPTAVAAVHKQLAPREDHPRRRFPEVVQPGLRAAFTLYEYLVNAALVLGYCSELDGSVVDLDLAGLREAWRAVAFRATAGAARDGDWAALRLDFAGLDTPHPLTADPLLDEAWRAVNRYAPLRLQQPPAPAGSAPPAEPTESAEPAGSAASTEPADSMAAAPSVRRLRAAWRSLRAADRPVGVDVVDRAFRSAGFGFREGCAAIEFAAQRAASAKRR